jgi:hypothetical protein
MPRWRSVVWSNASAINDLRRTLAGRGAAVPTSAE